MDSFKSHYQEKFASLEKKVVIVDIGKRYTKVGFSGESHPRCIVQTKIRDHITEKEKSVFEYTTQSDLYDNIVEFFHHLYFKRLLISPKDTKVVLCESLLSVTVIRETIAQVLFRHLQVSSLLFIPAHMVALYTLAVNTAMVLDIGHEEACLIPVFEGYPVLHAYQAYPLAGAAVEKNLRELLVSVNEGGDRGGELIKSLPDKTIEDIKVRLCFVTSLKRIQQEPAPEPPPSCDYPLAGKGVLKVPGTVREKAWEVLFDLDADNISISTIFLEVLLKCPVDMRRPLSQSILLIGGSAAAVGLKSRLLDELRYHIKAPRYASKLHVEEFKLHTAPCKEMCTAWLGAAMVGATELVNMQSVSIDDFKKQGDIPDWANLKYNTRQSAKLPAK